MREEVEEEEEDTRNIHRPSGSVYEKQQHQEN
jgi:hypothetical protein